MQLPSVIAIRSWPGFCHAMSDRMVFAAASGCQLAPTAPPHHTYPLLAWIITRAGAPWERGISTSLARPGASIALTTTLIPRIQRTGPTSSSSSRCGRSRCCYLHCVASGWVGIGVGGGRSRIGGNSWCGCCCCWGSCCPRGLASKQECGEALPTGR